MSDKHRTVQLPGRIPTHKIAVIKIIREATGLRLVGAKRIFDCRPIEVLCRDIDAAKLMVLDLAQYGVETRIVAEDPEDIIGTVMDLLRVAREDWGEEDDYDHHDLVDEAIQGIDDIGKLALLDAFGDRDLSHPAPDLKAGWGKLLGQLAFNALYAEVLARRSR